MAVKIANRETPIRLLHQKQSDLGLHCLSRPFWWATSVLYLRTFTVPVMASYVNCLLVTTCTVLLYMYHKVYSKTCVKRPLKNRPNKGLIDKW